MTTSPDESSRRTWLAWATRLTRFRLRTLLIAIPLAGIGAAYLAQLYQNSPQVPVRWDVESGENVLWKVPLGSQTYSRPIVSGEYVFIGSNNGAAYDTALPATVDLGVMLCFERSTGKFLWQHANAKLPTGRVHDWPLQGVTGSATVEGDRLWYISNRCEIVCLDVHGFRDGENDGPDVSEPTQRPIDADVVWKLDMMGKLGVSPHNASCCGLALMDSKLFLCTGNGVDEGHVNVPNPKAPSFLAVDKRTGQILWQDVGPGEMVLHGQWATPTCGRLGGVKQAIFAGGDGWLYSYAADGDGRGGARLLWKCDCNEKTSKWVLGGRGQRNNIIAGPVIHNGRVYVATGQDPEHGEGVGRVVCIDPTRRGDVSATLVQRSKDSPRPPSAIRLQACDPAAGEKETPNPNSAVLWQYAGNDLNGNGKVDFLEQMHRSLSQPAFAGGLLLITDTTGIVHCIDVETGAAHWTQDLFASSWSTPQVLGDHLLVGDEDGNARLYALSSDVSLAAPGGNPVATMLMPESVYSTATAIDGVLYLATRKTLYAIADPEAQQRWSRRWSRWLPFGR